MLVPEPILALLGYLVIYEKEMNHIAAAGDASFQFLTYQLSMGRYWLPVAMTGNGELGFDSGDGACETASTSKGPSRRANYPI